MDGGTIDLEAELQALTAELDRLRAGRAGAGGKLDELDAKVEELKRRIASAGNGCDRA
jgi:hypothetical protein